MHRVAIAFLLVSTLAGASFAQSSKRASTTRRNTAPSAEQKQQFADGQEAINKLHDLDIQASLALDADKLESLWTDDIVTIAPGGPPVVGIGANRAKLDKMVAQMRSVEILAYDEQFQEVRVAGDWAFEYGVITGRTRPFQGGDETSSKVNVLRVLQRQPDGNWKIARSIYNDATLPPEKPAEAPKPKAPERNKLED